MLLNFVSGGEAIVHLSESSTSVPAQFDIQHLDGASNSVIGLHPTQSILIRVIKFRGACVELRAEKVCDGSLFATECSQFLLRVDRAQAQGHVG